MAKYSFKFKKQIVLKYLNGEGSYETLAVKYGISSITTIKSWVAAFNKFGDDGLIRSRKRQVYSFDFKLSMVESYLTGEQSYQELALANNINNPSLIARWVIDFREGGSDALRPHEKGRKPMKKSNDKKTVEPAETSIVDTSAEHIKALEDENLRLRIENAFLKELRRLRLEEEAKTRRLHESSAVSEDSSD